MSAKALTERSQHAANSAGRRTVAATVPPALAAGGHGILQLQRTFGNRSVAQLLQANRLTADGRIVQRKPAGATVLSDSEREADRHAQELVSHGIPVADPEARRLQRPNAT